MINEWPKLVLIAFLALLSYLIWHLGGVDASTQSVRHNLCVILLMIAGIGKISSNNVQTQYLNSSLRVIILSGVWLVYATSTLFWSSDLSSGMQQVWLLIDALLIFIALRWALSEKKTSLWWMNSLCIFATVISMTYLIFNKRLIYNPNHFATLMSILVFFPLHLWWRDNPNQGLRRLYLICTIICWTALLVTLSRAGIMAASLALIIVLIKQAKLKAVLSQGMIRLMLMGALLISIFAWFSHDKTTLTSINTRVELTKTSLRLFLLHPVVGMGLGSFAAASLQAANQDTSYLSFEYAHNDYLQLAVELGSIGLLLTLAWLILMLRFSWRHVANRPYGYAALSGLLAALIHAFFDFSLHIPCNLLLFAGLAASLITLSSNTEQKITNSPWRFKVAGLVALMIMLLPLSWLMKSSTPYQKKLLLKQSRAEQTRGDWLQATTTAHIAYAMTQDSETLIELIRLYQATGLHKESQPLFQRALAMDPNNWLLKELYATHLLTNNQASQALNLFKEVFAHHPERVSPHLDELFAEIKNPWQLQAIIPQDEKAAAVWLQALGRRNLQPLQLSESRKYAEIFPQCNQPFVFNTIDLLIGQGSAQEATTALMQFRQKCAANVFQIAMLSGKLATLTHDPSLALKHYVAALSNTPNDVQALRLAVQISEQSEALLKLWQNHLAKLLTQYPDSSELLFEQARIYKKQGEWDKAVQVTKSLVSRNLHEPSYKKQLAQLYIEKKHYGPALQLLRDLTLSNPKDIDTYLDLATIYSSLNLIDQARKALESGLAIDPNNQRLTAALAHLIKKTQ